MQPSRTFSNKTEQVIAFLQGHANDIVEKIAKPVDKNLSGEIDLGMDALSAIYHAPLGPGGKELGLQGLIEYANKEVDPRYGFKRQSTRINPPSVPIQQIFEELAADKNSKMEALALDGIEHVEMNKRGFLAIVGNAIRKATMGAVAGAIYPSTNDDEKNWRIAQWALGLAITDFSFAKIKEGLIEKRQEYLEEKSLTSVDYVDANKVALAASKALENLVQREMRMSRQSAGI